MPRPKISTHQRLTRHAGRQRVLFIDEPAGQFDAVAARAFLQLRQRRGRVRLDRLAAIEEAAPLEDRRLTRLAFDHDQRGHRLDGGDLLVDRGNAARKLLHLGIESEVVVLKLFFLIRIPLCRRFCQDVRNVLRQRGLRRRAGHGGEPQPPDGAGGAVVLIEAENEGRAGFVAGRLSRQHGRPVGLVKLLVDSPTGLGVAVDRGGNLVLGL